LSAGFFSTSSFFWWRGCDAESRRVGLLAHLRPLRDGGEAVNLNSANTRRADRGTDGPDSQDPRPPPAQPTPWPSASPHLRSTRAGLLGDVEMLRVGRGRMLEGLQNGEFRSAVGKPGDGSGGRNTLYIRGREDDPLSYRFCTVRDFRSFVTVAPR
jgi:hypothetical protein